ncbi:MAG: efflux RND transporter permease subunit [Deltaproteobacteria bacterium]|nr:efflux RND transporter permease subunit [Deltaproteobacteria bacterium]
MIPETPNTPETIGNLGPAGRIARFFIDSKLTPLIIISAILLGIGAVMALPREEEPQIIVPMIDVLIQMPGATAKEVEKRVSGPLEKLFWEIPGVEYLYSTSSPGQSLVVVRFKVGEDEEGAIVRLQAKLMANLDRMPPGVSPPLIKPRYIDDVPILTLTFWSAEADHYTLRRVAAAAAEIIKREPDVSLTQLIGGEKRSLNILVDPARLAARGLGMESVTRSLMPANQAVDAGSYPTAQEGEIIIHVDGQLDSADAVGRIILGSFQGGPVYLRDVARISDGPAEPEQYVFFGSGPAAPTSGLQSARQQTCPAVTLTVAKRKGSNATEIAHRVLERLDEVKGSVIPDNIEIAVTRDYGETAKEKSNELLLHMLIAVISVCLLIWFSLGRREAGVVLFAIPVTLALTLTVFYLHGYTLNRITLFALIFSIGILVDDAIVVVENIVRHYHLPENRERSATSIALEAVNEVGNPTILATMTVIAAILPMAYVGGLMGPYMRPIPVGASAAMLFSLIVAFIVTPWASIRLLRRQKSANPEAAARTTTSEPQDTHTPHGHPEDASTRFYRHIMSPLLHRPLWRWSFLGGVLLLLVGSASLVAFGLVRVKMLPFDNKSEFQVILDLPETATLEMTANAALEMADYLRTVNEVTDYQLYIGTSGPFNFNGLVRHYYFRRGPQLADLQVNLAAKGRRREQSHAIAKRLRPALKKIADRYQARVKIAEVPPGPPVLSTLVVEVYGPDYAQQRQLALHIRDLMEATDGVVDVDWYMEENEQRFKITVDREKAALNGISTAQVVETLQLTLGGKVEGLLHLPQEEEDVPLTVRPPLALRGGIERLRALQLPTGDGHLVAIADLVRIEAAPLDRSIYHKNLLPVVYVTGDVAGAKESPVYAILELKKKIAAIVLPDGYHIAQHTASLPESDRHFSIKWDGEWHITYEVFRDLGLAFAAVLLLIFVLVVGWFQSFSTPLTIMAAIPFSLIGILPAHWAMGAFFTATSMIGFIAGAGIVVRNSIILVDFIELRLSQGMPLDEAVIDAGAVRFRPMMLTAAAVVVGASVILFDPIFQGLALSLMAGEVASLLFSRMTVPILYFLDKRWESAHQHGHSQIQRSS